MQNNVIYGAFPATRAATHEAESGSITRLAENTPATLSNRIHAQLNVLSDLGTVINEPGLPKEIGDPLREELKKLQTTANQIAMRLIRAHTDDKVFLEVQTEITTFGRDLVDFETEVLHRTGAEIELIDPPSPPVLSQMKTALGNPKKWVDSPTFWIGASVGMAALSGFVWWLVHKEKPEKEDFTKTVTRVKLKRALPAR